MLSAVDSGSGINYVTGATYGPDTYTYDADGNRVRRSNGNLAASGTLYWYMTPGVVAETDLAGTLKSEYVFFDGERVARRDGANGTGGVFYYFSDHLKTASVITDSAGVIKAESDYYPWGGELQFVNNDSNDYKFTGKKRDIETGLDYFGARYYSNELGRFVSADWSAVPVPVPYADFGDPQSLNLYGYVRGLPTTRFDADGHDDVDKARRQAVRDAWKQEKALIAAGQEGTVKWTDAQKAELLKTGKVKGFEGHHINSVNGSPELASNPNNIKFVEGRVKNLAEHAGDFRNATKGALLNRSLGVVSKVATVVAIGVAIHNIANAPNGQKLGTAAREGGGLGGAIVGGEVGMKLGLLTSEFTGPVGPVIGAVGGAIVGGIGGQKAVDSVLSPSVDNSKQIHEMHTVTPI
ncbi:MAG TPA: RHS repeat-associated core domain-containing protein [Verrucomicrobiae bacterium]|nr:RHS repeat-associated core domain-containing protein [Verrucomicrobiae bacterium]